MPDRTPLSDAELEDVEAAIRADAAILRAIVLRMATSPDVALAMLGVVAGELLDRVSPEMRAEWFSSFDA